MDEDTFKLIYSQFFPQGGESEASPPWLLPTLPARPPWHLYKQWVSPLRGKGSLPPPFACSLELPLSSWKGGAPQPRNGNTPQPLPLVSPDATTYAHFLFNAFDADGNGAIRFEVGPRCPLPHPLPL